MTSPALGFTQPGQSLQRLKRTFRHYTDQHGRVFTSQADMNTNAPLEELRPLNEGAGTFNPPWLPPMRFAKFRVDGDLHFRWDYTTMATELSGDTAQYYQDAVKFAIENNKPEPEVGGPVDRSIRYVLGPPPLSPAVPIACEQGDPWMLGQPNAPVNPMMKAILEQGGTANSKEALEYIRKLVNTNLSASTVPLVASEPERIVAEPKAKTISDPVALKDLPLPTYKEFMQECRGRGMTIAEINGAWKEYKQNLGEAE